MQMKVSLTTVPLVSDVSSYNAWKGSFPLVLCFWCQLCFVLDFRRTGAYDRETSQLRLPTRTTV